MRYLSVSHAHTTTQNFPSCYQLEGSAIAKQLVFRLDLFIICLFFSLAQKRQSQATPKSTSEKYSPLEDGAEGFPIDPPSGTENGFPQSGHPGPHGNLWTKNVNKDVRSYSSMRVPNGPQLRIQRSYKPRSGADFSNFPASVAARGSSNLRYNQLDVTEPSEKQMLDGPSSTHKKDYGVGGKDLTAMVSYDNKLFSH